MSAVVTKKLGGDYATQLTFPAVFEAQAKANNLTSQFYPDVRSRPMELLTGSGLQQDYHEQKRLDANRRCLNGVKDNAASMARYLGSHANYIVPKPVLGQRIFANPSNGNQADIYSSRPIQWNQSMSGGVLRTKEGQEWAMNKLKERIPQLDAIKAAKDAFLLGGPLLPSTVESVGISDITAKVELYGLLNRVQADLQQGVVNSKTVEKSQSLLKLLFAFTPYAETREVEEIMVKIEEIGRDLNGILEEEDEGVGISELGEAKYRSAEYLANLYVNMFQYLTRMNGVLNRPRKEREKASAIFIKSLGFSELEKKLPRMSARIRRQIAAADAANPNADPEGEEEKKRDLVDDEGKGDDGDDGDDDDSEDNNPPPPRTAPQSQEEVFFDLPTSPASSASSSGLSTFPTSASSSGISEAEQARYVAMMEEERRKAHISEGKEEKLDIDNHQTFGNKSGSFFGEAPLEEVVGPRDAMKSAELGTEERKTEAPEFEPAVTDAAAAAAADAEPVYARRPPQKPRPMRKQTPEEVLTPEEYDNYLYYKEAAKAYPPWIRWDTWNTREGRAEAVRNAHATGYFTSTAALEEDKQQRLKRKLDKAGVLPTLITIKNMEDKIANASMVPKVPAKK